MKLIATIEVTVITANAPLITSIDEWITINYHQSLINNIVKKWISKYFNVEMYTLVRKLTMLN